MTDKPVILCVDDEEDIRILITDLLSEEGYQVICAPSGEDALIILERQLDIDLILLDLMMPSLSGLEVLKLLKANPETADIPVIILTADGQISAKREAFSLGSHDYLVKPFETEELHIRIIHHIERKKTDEALRESEENFQVFFETMTDLIIVATNEGRILFSNGAVTEKLGYTKGELEGMHLLDLHPPDRRDEATEIVKAMINGERTSCPLPLQTKTGGLLPVETRVWQGVWNREKCLFGISKDLTAETEARERFEKLFHNNPALMALSLLPERTFVDVNEAFLSTLGYRRDEVLENTAAGLNLFFNPDQQKKVAEELMKTGRISHTELDVRCRDGSIKTGLFSGEVIHGQIQQYFLTVMVDITDQRRAEQQIRLAHERFSLAADAAGFGTWDLDLFTNNLVWDDWMFHLYGIEKDRFSGGYEAWEKTVHPDDLHQVVLEVEQAIQGEKSFDTEFRIIRPDREIRFLKANAVVIRDKDGLPLRMIGINYDITARKIAENALRESEKNFKLFFSKTPDPILIVDSRGNIIEVNSGFEKKFGYRKDEISGILSDDLNIHLTHEVIIRAGDACQAGDNIRPEEIILIDKNKTPFICEIAVSPMVIQAESCLLVQIHDIDEIRRAEEAVTTANKKLSTLSSITRHDILNRVMVITSYSEFLKDTINGEKALQQLSNIGTAGTDIQHLIEFTRYYQEIGTVEPVWQEIENLLARRSIQGLISGVTLTSNLGSLSIYADLMLEKVLYNLIENSVRHGQNLKSITFSFHEENGEGGIWYEDDGGGISADEKEKVFKRGFGKNTGMGLFLIREILSITGISIRETGEPGKGVRFEILVPEGKWRR